MDGVFDELLPLFSRRDAMLGELRGEPISKSALVSSLDISRSTVDRAMRELADHDLVERTGQGWVLTLAGELLVEEYENFRRRVAGIERAHPLLSSLPPNVGLAPSALAGAEVVMADRTAPYRPAEAYLDLLRSSDRAWLLNTALTEQYVEELEQLAVAGDPDLDVACADCVVERLIAEHREVLDTALKSGTVTMRELDDDLPFSQGVFEIDGERRLAVLVYVDDGLKGAIVNDDPAAVAWGESFFTEHWEAADPIPTPPATEDR
ncbi:helix-turn-helix transcriptional regulator [Natronomonas sp. EA1]|uniref:helix-turn-helix transcriptional regulator n=1 Tax=Natronomonas sp. EA1 TaxID=3421655 RepID=UPI003EB8BA93